MTGEPASALDWSGEDNDFVAWPGWLTAGPEASVRVADVEGLRRSYPGSDITSRESTTPWPASKYPDEIMPLEFAEMAPALKATLAKVAVPQARLRDLTLGSLPRLATPELSLSMIPPNAPGAFDGPGERDRGPGRCRRDGTIESRLATAASERDRSQAEERCGDQEGRRAPTAPRPLIAGV